MVFFDDLAWLDAISFDFIGQDDWYNWTVVLFCLQIMIKA